MATVIQTTFVQVTFVHIRKISAVTDSIFTRLFGPNVLILVRPKIVLHKIFQTQNFLDPIFFWTQIFFNLYLLDKIFFDLTFFNPNFFNQSFFCQAPVLPGLSIALLSVLDRLDPDRNKSKIHYRLANTTFKATRDHLRSYPFTKPNQIYQTEPNLPNHSYKTKSA